MTQSRPAKRPVHTFAGVTVCACGKKMYVPTNTPKYVCTACRNKIPIVEVETMFLERIQGLMESAESLTEYLERTSGAINDKQRLVEAMRAELRKVSEAADQTYQLYLDKGLNSVQFKERYQPLDTRKHELEAELPKIEAEVDTLKINSLSTEEIMARAKDLPTRWKSMTPDERRQLIEVVVKEIMVGPNTFDVTLYELPIFEFMTNRQRML